MTLLTGSRSIRAPRRFLRRYGPWAVVTGGSSGIGLEMAQRLAAAGFGVVLAARGRTALERAAAQLWERHAAHTRVIAVDLAEPAGIEAIEAGTTDLDVGLLVAAAGFGASRGFLDTAPGLDADMLAVNCGAVTELTRHFGNRFAARGGGIVLMSSLLGRQGAPGSAVYAATKAYVQALAEGLHVELRPRGVDVLACAPGPVHSGFAARAGMRMPVALTPAQVAARTLNALGRRTTISPGTLSATLTWSLAPLPRQARTRIMGVVMRGMTERPNSAVEQAPARG